MSNDLNQKNSIAGAQGAAQAAGDAAAQSAGNNAAAGTAGIGGADVSAIMKKYDRESNTRIWTGRRKQAIRLITAAFSLWCIYVTLFATFLEEIRLTSFLALIIMLGFLTYPAKKGEQKPDYMPWYDILFMILGTSAFLYFTFNAQNIIQQGTRFAPYQIVIGIIGLLALIVFPDLRTLVRPDESRLFRACAVPRPEFVLHKRRHLLNARQRLFQIHRCFHHLRRVSGADRHLGVFH